MIPFTIFLLALACSSAEGRAAVPGRGMMRREVGKEHEFKQVPHAKHKSSKTEGVAISPIGDISVLYKDHGPGDGDMNPDSGHGDMGSDGADGDGPGNGDVTPSSGDGDGDSDGLGDADMNQTGGGYLGYLAGEADDGHTAIPDDGHGGLPEDDDDESPTQGQGEPTKEGWYLVPASQVTYVAPGKRDAMRPDGIDGDGLGDGDMNPDSGDGDIGPDGADGDGPGDANMEPESGDSDGHSDDTGDGDMDQHGGDSDGDSAEEMVEGGGDGTEVLRLKARGNSDKHAGEGNGKSKGRGTDKGKGKSKGHEKVTMDTTKHHKDAYSRKHIPIEASNKEMELVEVLEAEFKDFLKKMQKDHSDDHQEEFKQDTEATNNIAEIHTQASADDVKSASSKEGGAELSFVITPQGIAKNENGNTEDLAATAMDLPVNQTLVQASEVAASHSAELKMDASKATCCRVTDLACNADPAGGNCQVSGTHVLRQVWNNCCSNGCCGGWNMDIRAAGLAVPLDHKKTQIVREWRGHAIDMVEKTLRFTQIAKNMNALNNWQQTGRGAYSGMSNWETRRWRASWLKFFGDPRNGGPALDMLLARLHQTLTYLKTAQYIESSRITGGTIWPPEFGRPGQIHIKPHHVDSCMQYRDLYGWHQPCPFGQWIGWVLIAIHEATHLPGHGQLGPNGIQGTTDVLPGASCGGQPRCNFQWQITPYVVSGMSSSNGWLMDETKRAYLLNHASTISFFIYHTNGWWCEMFNWCQRHLWD